MASWHTTQQTWQTFGVTVIVLLWPVVHNRRVAAAVPIRETCSPDARPGRAKPEGHDRVWKERDKRCGGRIFFGDFGMA